MVHGRRQRLTGQRRECHTDCPTQRLSPSPRKVAFDRGGQAIQAEKFPLAAQRFSSHPVSPAFPHPKKKLLECHSICDKIRVSREQHLDEFLLNQTEGQSCWIHQNQRLLEVRPKSPPGLTFNEAFNPNTFLQGVRNSGAIFFCLPDADPGSKLPRHFVSVSHPGVPSVRNENADTRHVLWTGTRPVDRQPRNFPAPRSPLTRDRFREPGVRQTLASGWQLQHLKLTSIADLLCQHDRDITFSLMLRSIGIFHTMPARFVAQSVIRNE